MKKSYPETMMVKGPDGEPCNGYLVPYRERFYDEVLKDLSPLIGIVTLQAMLIVLMPWHTLMCAGLHRRRVRAAPLARNEARDARALHVHVRRQREGHVLSGRGRPRMRAKLYDIAMQALIVVWLTIAAAVFLALHVVACAVVADRCLTSHPYDPKAACAAPNAKLGPNEQDAGP
jgi:hypothetical protein